MFEIGEPVICVDATMQEHTREELLKDTPNWVTEGRKYTVRGFTDNDGIVDGIWLEEIRNPIKYFRLIGKFQEPAFATWRFRKLEPAELQVETEQLTEMA